MRRVRAAADESTSAVADSLRPSTNRVYEAHKFIAASDRGNREPSTAETSAGARQVFAHFPPRERWVGDAAAYNKSDVR